ncbi:MAG: glycosyltransferase family A protein [Dehalococcoidia bacterium]|nr:glycosyltransferase family A protein [Dehalococcoidia bacterium]
MYDEAYEATSRRENALPAAISWRNKFLEAYPALISWLVLTAPIWLTLIHPIVGIAFVVLAMSIFVVKVIIYGVAALLNRERVLEATRTDWVSKLRNHPEWEPYRIVFLIRAFREGNKAMLTRTIDSIYQSDWRRNGERMVNVEVVFATEQGDAITPPLVDILGSDFANRLTVRQVIHPKEYDVLPGPSSAMHYVGRVLYDEVLRRKENPSKFIIIDLDSDTILHPKYLSGLMYQYLIDPNHDCRIYQPIVSFTLDYWNAPLHSRLAALGTSALTLGWNRFPEIAFTGAAGNMALYQSVDFWPTQSHSQDSGVELRLRMRYGNDFDVTGVPIPTRVYPVMAIGPRETWRERLSAYAMSFRVLFRQSARWREGPMDEFLEATRKGSLQFSLLKLWSGIERDTMTLLPGYGLIALSVVLDMAYPTYDHSYLQPLATGVLSLITLLGLAVFWQVLHTPEFVEPMPNRWRKIFEMLLFWVAFSFYIPILTACAGLKTSTAYAFGKKPTTHYAPTPK